MSLRHQHVPLYACWVTPGVQGGERGSGPRAGHMARQRGDRGRDGGVCVRWPQLSKDEIEEVTEVFDLFDFWDGRDGAVDAAKTGDMLYCLGLNPTMTTIMKNGGVEKFGEKNYKLEEFLPIYQTVMQIKDTGTYADFMEAFKTFDREGQGFISSAELRHVLTSLGDRLTDTQMDDIIKCTDLREDLEGNVKYEDFISKVMAGPYPDK
ncbi:myosin, essential light chain, adductor muscle-like [Haliotis cracherodii]|uniref:myosin, essential light chain, adductor muscle-like n=1 Tax=Haliotis cracherodii TaxID=6455 RepID=UPI0039E97000